MDVRLKINKLRLDKGWSLSQLARKIGISETAIYNWYNENSFMPSVPVLQEVSRVFDISMSELFADVETDKFTPKELEMLEYFTKLSEDKKEVIIEMAKIILNEQPSK